MTLHITLSSWHLARSLGVTSSPPKEGTEYFAIELEEGAPVMLFWPIDTQLTKGMKHVHRINGR